MSLDFNLRLARRIGLLLLAALIYLVVTTKPELEFLSLEFNPSQESNLTADVIYLEGKRVAHTDDALTLRTDDYDRLFVRMPRHVEPDSVFFDIGTKPGNWFLQRVYYRSTFLIFSVAAYQWSNAALAQQLRPYLKHSVIDVGGPEGEQITITTGRWPHRFNLQLDHSTLQPTGQLMAAKAVIVAALIGLYLLLVSRYFWQLFATRAEDSAQLRVQSSEIWRNHRLVMLIGAIALFVLMLIMGNTNLLHPGLYIEDSMEFTDAMAGNMNLFSPESYLYYRGYQVFLSEWFVAISSLFPLEWQPYLYVLIGIVVAWLAINTMAYSGLITHPWAIALAPLALFIGSFNVPAMFLTLTGTFFSTTALLMALAVRPVPANNVVYVLSFLLMCAMAWSGPYAVQILPLAFGLILFASARRKTLLLLSLMVVAVFYTTGSASGMVQFENVLDAAIRGHYYDSVVSHIFLFGLVGKQEFYVGLPVIVAVLAALICFRGDRIYVKHSLLFIMSSLVSLLTYFISFKYGQYQGELISAHLIISQFMWMAFVVLTLDRLLRSVQQQKLQSVAGVVMVCILGALFYGKKSVEAQRETLLPDHDLTTFIKSVRYVQDLPLASDEFVQLWDVNHQGYITSYRKGASGPTASSISVDSVPAEFQKFVLPIDLNRKDNMLLQLLPSSKVWYSDQTFLDLPFEISRPQRESLRLH